MTSDRRKLLNQFTSVLEGMITKEGNITISGGNRIRRTDAVL